MDDTTPWTCKLSRIRFFTSWLSVKLLNVNRKSDLCNLLCPTRRVSFSAQFASLADICFDQEIQLIFRFMIVIPCKSYLHFMQILIAKLVATFKVWTHKQQTISRFRYETTSWCCHRGCWECWFCDWSSQNRSTIRICSYRETKTDTISFHK